MLDRLRRVTDLFIEGTEAFLGRDPADDSPVLIWVNKLNSFEVEEARQDGMVARGVRAMQLTKEDNPERLGVQSSMQGWSDTELINRVVEQKSEETYLDVLTDLEGDEKWREKLAMMRRMPGILEDAKVPDDDSRRQTLQEVQTEYLDALRVARDKAADAMRKDLKARDRSEIETMFFENWRSRISLDEFMAARRTTELFYSMRDCVAKDNGTLLDGKVRWDHSGCDHRTRLLNERSQVRTLPEPVLARVSELIDDITVGGRESGNSDAPPNSSGSSGSQSEAEESTPSTPGATEPAVPTISAPQ